MKRSGLIRDLQAAIGRRWVLHTRDMHSLYEKFGFGTNVRLMERGA